MLVIDAVHLWGERTFIDAMSPECASRNNALLLLPLLGENWHNNHHASPLSATTSVFWYAACCSCAYCPAHRVHAHARAPSGGMGIR